MMSFSTVQAEEFKRQEEEKAAAADKEPVLSEEDQRIKQMIEDLRKIIEEARIENSLRNKLNGMVDDLEERLKTLDTTIKKIAQISNTRDEIVKILENDIPYQLQQHDTTKTLGEALDSDDITKIEKAFEDMYNSITVLAGQKKYDQLKQTAEDILQSIDDAEARDVDLKEALEKLAEAFLKAIPPPPEEEGEEPKSDDEIDQEVQDAIKDALDAIKDNKDDIDQADKDIQDTINDAMADLGQEVTPPNEDNEDEKDEEKDEAEANKPSHPSNDGEIIYDSVIDGKTP